MLQKTILLAIYEEQVVKYDFLELDGRYYYPFCTPGIVGAFGTFGNIEWQSLNVCINRSFLLTNKETIVY